MNVLIVEDNCLVGEMMRLAVEDAAFTVVGPAATLEQGQRLAAANDLSGALVDIHLGGAKAFPIARLLQTKQVPFLFVTGYDRSVLPDDLKTAPLVSKPLAVGELTEMAVALFKRPPKDAAPRLDAMARAAALRVRIAQAEDRIATQRRRVERMQFTGYSADQVRLASDILDQMQTAVELMRETLRRLDDPVSRPGASISRPISDEIIDAADIGSLEPWAARFGVSIEQLLRLVSEVGPSAHQIARTLAQTSLTGEARKSKH